MCIIPPLINWDFDIHLKNMQISIINIFSVHAIIDIIIEDKNSYIENINLLTSYVFNF